MRRECILVDEHGQHIGVSAGRLEVRGKEETQSVPLEEVESLLLGPKAGGVSVRALLSLVREGASVSVLGEGGESLTLTPRSADGVALLRAQAKWSDGEGLRAGLELARRALRHKVRNQRHLAGRLSERRGGGRAGARLKGLHARLKALEASIDAWRPAPGATRHASASALMSLEARAARAWWAAVALTLPPGFSFTGRALSGDEQDPFNAALNYGYAILVARVTQALGALGFEPQLGFLHADAPPRVSLSYDVVECYRQPFVDWPLLCLAQERGEAWGLGEDGRLTVEAKRAVAASVLGALSEERSWGVGIEVIRGDARGLKESLLQGTTWRPQALKI